MKKIISLLLVFALLFCFASCGSDDSSYTDDMYNDTEMLEQNTEQSEQSNISINEQNLLWVGSFLNGRAWIASDVYNGLKRYSLIDKSGNIIYSQDSQYCSIAHDSEASSVCESINNDGKYTYKYKIVDNSGKVVASSESGAFDAILGQGDNLFFVYKYVSSLDAPKSMFGVIDQKGNFVQELRESPLLDVDITDYRDSVLYLGNGVFGVHIEKYFSTNGYFIYNSKTNKSFFLNNVNPSSKDGNIISIGDKLYFNGEESSGITYEADPNKIVSIGGDFSLASDGTYKKVNDFDYVVNNILMKNEYNGINTDRINLTLTDPTTNKSTVLSKYPVVTMEPIDDKFFVEADGKERKKYYFIMDKNYNILFEPVQADEAKANEGKMIIKKGSSFSVLDFSGNTLFETSEYTSISNYSDGIAWAEKEIDDNTKYYYGIDSSGNVVIS